MAVEYVDAGQAIDNSSLSGIVGSAPPVTDGVTYERILNARSEPQNWLTYSGNYSSTRYSPLDRITPQNVRNLKLQWVYQSPVAGNCAIDWTACCGFATAPPPTRCWPQTRTISKRSR